MWDYRGQKRPPFAVEPEPGQESVWDYPRPPKVIACNRMVEVMHNAVPIAHTSQTFRVLETASPPTFYIAKQRIDWSRLISIPGHSFCEWKGTASYYALADEPGATPVAWQYNDPLPGFEMIRGHLCFYPGRVACYVDGEPVRPQDSEFYGGWVTDEIVGPFKGNPGTGHW
jgi:uncharacterized protein (DUF427 family)